MENNHTPVMLDEVKSFLPFNKNINVLDATFGGGGYSRHILENFHINKLIAIDRDPLAKLFAKELKQKFSNFTFIHGCFGEIDKLVLNDDETQDLKFDAILFDLGVSSNQIDNPKRGFSFMQDGPLDMSMGLNNKTASDIVNSYSEFDLANIIYKYGEEKFSRKIAKNIVTARKIKKIETTRELADLIKKSFGKKQTHNSKINPATKTFQAIRIYINDELNELSNALNNSIKLLKIEGKIIIVSFQSLEDRIVKDFLNHNSGKRWRSSRHYPELTDDGPITLNIITKKPVRPSEQEITNNYRSRSAKLRVGEKVN